MAFKSIYIFEIQEKIEIALSKNHVLVYSLVIFNAVQHTYFILLYFRIGKDYRVMTSVK